MGPRDRSTGEIAAAFAKDAKTVFRWANGEMRGSVCPHERRGKAYLFNVEEVRAWLLAHGLADASVLVPVVVPAPAGAVEPAAGVPGSPVIAPPPPPRSSLRDEHSSPLGGGAAMDVELKTGSARRQMVMRMIYDLQRLVLELGKNPMSVTAAALNQAAGAVSKISEEERLIAKLEREEERERGEVVARAPMQRAFVELADVVNAALEGLAGAQSDALRAAGVSMGEVEAEAADRILVGLLDREILRARDRIAEQAKKAAEECAGGGDDRKGVAA